MPAVAAVAAVGALGYGIYSGEQAAKVQKRAGEQQIDAVYRQRAEDEARLRQERIESQQLLFDQEAQQKATEADLKKQQDDALAASKAAVPGIQAQLGSDLLAQEEHAYAKMAPQLENRLNALGLLQSGALPEAQAKYQGDLESQRQAALAQFGTNAAQQLSITQPLANSSADIQRQSQYLNNNLTTARDNLSQQFASAAQNSQNNVAQNQYLANLQAGSNFADQQRATSYMNAGAQIGSGLLGYYGSRTSNPATMSALDYSRRQSSFYGAGNSGPVNYRY